MSWQYKCGANTLILLFFKFWHPFWEEIRKYSEVNLKNKPIKRSDYEIENYGSHGLKKEERVIQQDSRPKRGQISQEKKNKEATLHMGLRKITKKPRSSMLYQIKINLKRTSRLSLCFMQLHSLKNISQREAFTTDAICEVHPVSNNSNQVKKMDELLNDPFRKKKQK